jgi:hypothetical protein
MAQKRNFKGIWIPKEIWLDAGLTMGEKLFLCEIDSLDNEQGCFASNNYFAKFFSITPQRASQIINSLVEKRKLSRELIMDGDRVAKRILRVVNKFDTPYQENLRGYQEKFKDNNTVNNTEDPLKEDRKVLKEIFFDLYRKKAKELKGEEVSPIWKGAEGKLLKEDTDSVGPIDLKKYIELFFSDKVPEVRSFTREVNKAGYSYRVFHGMISKLQLTNVKLKAPCPDCGMRGGHTLDCPVYLESVMARREEEEELRKLRDESEPVDLTGALKSKVKTLRRAQNG